MDSSSKDSGHQGGSAFINEETEKKKMNPKEIVISFAKKAALFIIGYVICYLNLSLTLPILTICTLVFFETQTSGISKKISSKSKASSYTKKDLLKVVDELPSWVTFPDRERAEWLNEIIGQLWPSISLYVIKLCRTKLQTKIQKKFDGFKFEEIDFGFTPPKIDGVKVYNKNVTKDSIIIDFDLYYDGDCTINFSVSGTQIGRIKDFQVGAELRLVLKPLMIKMPLIGGIQIFFLNTPDINFELEGISGIPGLSYFIRQKIEERITKKLVFPNKVTKRFSKSVEAAELKSLEPAGVLRVHVFEAKDLERKDVTGKSDPYVVLTVGAQERKTPVIKRDLNPKWDYWCEFVILDPVGQHLHFKMFDQDDLNEDDFMGSGIIEIHQAIKDGENDKWFNLDNAKHGKIHLRFTWLGLSANQEDLQAALKEIALLKVADISSALLTIYLDTAQDLQRVKSKKPEPYVTLTVNKYQQKSRVKKHTCDPMWEQGFSICVPNPETDSLNLAIIDKESETKLGQLTYHIKDLFRCPDMQISKEEFNLTNSSGKIVISLQLRILMHNKYECDESDTDSENDSNEISRDNSVRSSSRKFRTITTSTSVNDSTPPRTPSQPQTPVIEKEVTFERQSSLRSSQSSVRSSSFKVKPELGQMEISLFYSAPRQKLVITIHRISNLPLKDPSHIPDPYVKLKLIGLGSQKLKNKTKVIMDNCDPVYEETFEYLVSNSDLPNNKLVLTVKSKKMFNSFVMGQVIINLNNFQGLNEPFKEWYELSHAEESD
ncbi:extended synaptotagmin-2-like [Diorhabda carinulata]|uniref:extended synaptotagmin-2-like n=1 Tax=Diorhabda carinulata TaxID=1163345 RepID=UPI0025A28475|nr:extended synaptotagmin-2-like [Diorhabda carinulata]XP_057654258.1 extended synaptotagmin-2-like [Diorhabda carinulata]XP_057654259.1 extended synaptotagmin-2-like [Diorhabda carinulata]XP_057654260.1 extended synaptotagmin-2-like [Diorhabda carinulata]